MSLAGRNRQGTNGLKGTKKEIKGKWSRMKKEKIYIKCLGTQGESNNSAQKTIRGTSRDELPELSSRDDI